MVCVCVKHLEVKKPHSQGDQLLGGEGVKESQDGREDQVEEEQGGHRPGGPVVGSPCVDAAGDEPGVGQNTMR